ncbi:MAG: DNA replication and repair protein RecF [Candidatus Omnitrophica bacterium]|nr:DNA replication and repair protein RecF [Candidatus Omnitrophota bacterium]
MIGRNAQGKTSLLESVYFLATATSHRTRLTRELIRNRTETAFVRAEYTTEGEAHTLSAGLDGKTRRFRLDGEVLTKSAELYGHLRAVFFSPEDLEFVSGSPNVRRRALDLGLCQKQPRMIGHLLDYRRVLKQRNATLKQNSRNKDIAALLQAWEPLLVKEGAKIISERAQYTLQLMGFAADYYSYLTGAEERLECEYRCSGTRHHWKSPDEIPDIATLEEAFTKNLHAHLERDLAMKTTTCGPHRDDIVMSISGSSAHRYASQGQKRSIALSTKLAERDLLIEGDEPPILLVDDVTHEMDKHRCEKFFEKILTDAQVFLTFTEESSHRGLLDFANRWSVRAGKVEPLQP